MLEIVRNKFLTIFLVHYHIPILGYESDHCPMVDLLYYSRTLKIDMCILLSCVLKCILIPMRIMTILEKELRIG